MERLTQVLLCHPHGLMRTGLRAIIDGQAGMRVAGEAGDGHQAVSLAARLRPDVVVTDVLLPGLDGIQVTRRIRADTALAAVNVIVLTDMDASVLEAVRARANGLLLRCSDTAELLYAIRAIAAGDAFVAPPIARLLLDRLGSLLPSRAAADAAGSLTGREQEVLRLIADGRSNGEIADALFIGETTVKYHISHLLEKLNLRDRLQAAVFAHRSGLA